MLRARRRVRAGRRGGGHRFEQDVYTALYGFGAGLPVTDEDGRYTGGYRKKLTFGEVNGGINWVGDEDARLVWGRWNADRTAKVHSFGQVTFSECDDPDRLLALTRKALVDAVICRVTIGTVQQVDYAVTSSLAADVAALQNDVAGIDGNLSVATSVQVVESTVTTAIDDLDELADLDF